MSSKEKKPELHSVTLELPHTTQTINSTKVNKQLVPLEMATEKARNLAKSKKLDHVYGDNISEKCGKGRDWRGQVWKRPDFRRVCGGTAPEQGRDVAVILRKTASAAVGAFFAPRKAPGGPTNGVAGNDAQTYESPQKRRRQAISGGLWYKMSRMASSRKSQQQTLEDEPPGP